MAKSPAKQRLTWSEKLHRSSGLPKVVPIGPAQSKHWGQGTMVVPAPLEVDAIMKSIPPGRLITIQEIRSIIAQRHGATIGCPLTTGIFAWIAAHAAAEEVERHPERQITPYWRTLKSGGLLNDRYPGGIEAQRSKLEAEGHTVIQTGKRVRVAEHERFLITNSGSKHE
jgi:hypothetical protein